MSKELTEATIPIVYKDGYRTKVTLPVAVILCAKGAAVRADRYDALKALEQKEREDKVQKKLETTEENTAKRAVRQRRKSAKTEA